MCLYFKLLYPVYDVLSGSSCYILVTQSPLVLACLRSHLSRHLSCTFMGYAVKTTTRAGCEFAEKTRSTGMTLTIGLVHSIGLAIVRLGVAASLDSARAVGGLPRRPRQRVDRPKQPVHLARDGARWREMARDGGGPQGGARAWCRHAMAWHTHGACVHRQKMEKYSPRAASS